MDYSVQSDVCIVALVERDENHMPMRGATDTAVVDREPEFGCR